MLVQNNARLLARIYETECCERIWQEKYKHFPICIVPKTIKNIKHAMQKHHLSSLSHALFCSHIYKNLLWLPVRKTNFTLHAEIAAMRCSSFIARFPWISSWIIPFLYRFLWCALRQKWGCGGALFTCGPESISLLIAPFIIFFSASARKIISSCFSVETGIP